MGDTDLGLSLRGAPSWRVWSEAFLSPDLSGRVCCFLGGAGGGAGASSSSLRLLRGQQIVRVWRVLGWKVVMLCAAWGGHLLMFPAEGRGLQACVLQRLLLSLGNQKLPPEYPLTAMIGRESREALFLLCPSCPKKVAFSFLLRQRLGLLCTYN